MLIPLLRRFLAPYKLPILCLVLLQLIATLAALFLPSLNADIIDNGVTVGDTGYILSAGGVML